MGHRVEEDDGACGTLPAELLPAGAVPQYGSIFAALHSSDRKAFAGPYRTAQDGKTIFRIIRTPRVAFYFRDQDDNDSDPPFGALVRLQFPEGAVTWGGTSIGPQPETRAESTPAVSWERVGDRLGGSVIAVSFGGVYPPGSAGPEFGKAMIGFLQFILDETRAAGVIIDLTSLDYVWGDTIIGGLAMPLTEKGKRVRPAVIVAAGRTADALQSLLAPNFLLGMAGVRLVRTRQEAVAYIDQVLGHHMAAKALIGGMIDAWNRGDAEGFASMFAPYAEYVTSQGQRIWGREGIAKLVRQAGPGSQGVVLSEPSVECDGKAGKARFSWATADQGTAARRGVTTCTLIRKETRWMVLALEERRHHG